MNTPDMITIAVGIDQQIVVIESTEYITTFLQKENVPLVELLLEQPALSPGVYDVFVEVVNEGDPDDDGFCQWIVIKHAIPVAVFSTGKVIESIQYAVQQAISHLKHEKEDV